jgi:uncharacterized protein YjbI with pentapeptide repeats
MAELTRDEVIVKVKAGESLADKDLCRLNLSRLNLHRADLCRAKLIDTDLSGADLRKACFSNADLSQTKLRYADLAGADLSGAHLADADLCHANLSQANLDRAHLTGANLSLANLNEANLNKADLYGADLLFARLIKARLSKAEIIHANLTKADFIKASLKGANLRESNLDSTDFMDADLSGAELTGANIWNTNTVGWNIEGVSCEYIYNCKYNEIGEEKEKTRRNFAPGEFIKLYCSFPTLELIFEHEYQHIDYLVLLAVLSDINRRLTRGHIKLSYFKQALNATVALQAESRSALEQAVELLPSQYKLLFEELHGIRAGCNDLSGLEKKLRCLPLAHRQVAEYCTQALDQVPQAPKILLVSGERRSFNPNNSD